MYYIALDVCKLAILDSMFHFLIYCVVTIRKSTERGLKLVSSTTCILCPNYRTVEIKWNSVQQNHLCDTDFFFQIRKRKVMLALKCMANYKFRA